MSQMSLHIAVAFDAGRMIHRVTPSNSQPSISFRVSHMPSPWFNFLTEMESLVGLFGSAGKID